MDKKYEFTEETKVVYGVTLHRIRALREFGDVDEGELGGFIEKEENLSHEGNAWVAGDAWVAGNARVGDDAYVGNNALVAGTALVADNAWVAGNARIEDNNDYLCFKGLGSCNRNTTFFKCSDDEIKVICGCFFGTLTEFEKKVKETHAESKYAKEYLACVEVVRVHFGLEVEAEPVKRGKWIDALEHCGMFVCSDCEYQSTVLYRYCPNCGAKMDGGTDNA